MPRPQPQIVLVPGMAADERLFAAQKTAFPNLIVPPWIVPRSGESLAAYAERFAVSIPVHRPLVLGGCSLGGMIAYEMAHVLRPDALVLIASAASCEAIPWHLRALARIAWIIPPGGYALGKLFAPLLSPIFGGRKPEHRRLVASMFRDTLPGFLRWTCIAVGGWQPRPAAGVPTFAIHGDNDWILPLGKRDADYVIRGAGHLLCATHAEEVNLALKEIVDMVARQASSPEIPDPEKTSLPC